MNRSMDYTGSETSVKEWMPNAGKYLNCQIFTGEQLRNIFGKNIIYDVCYPRMAMWSATDGVQTILWLHNAHVHEGYNKPIII